MKAFNYSTRHANAIHVLNRLLNKETLTADQIREYDDQGRVIEYINNKLLVPVDRMKVQNGDESVRVWYLTDKTISDYCNNRSGQYSQQLQDVIQARQYRKAITTAGLLSALGEVVPDSIRAILSANEDSLN